MYVSIETGEQDEDDNILINVINCSFYEVPQVEETGVSLPRECGERFAKIARISECGVVVRCPHNVMIHSAERPQ